MILVNILTSRYLHLDIPVKLTVLAYTQTSTFGRIQFLKPNSLAISQLFIQEDDIISEHISKATSLGGLGKVCVHVFLHAYIFCILYNVFKVLSTGLFLLDYYDDSIKIAIDLFTTTALPKSKFRF